MTDLILPVDIRKGDRIFRYEVPIDDEWHTIEIFGDPLAVFCRYTTTVEFWAANSGPRQPRAFIVVGTGHEVPEDSLYWGSALSPHLHVGGVGEVSAGRFVWHLLERAS